MYRALKSIVPASYKQGLSDILVEVRYVLVNAFLYPLELLTRSYITFHMRPKYTSDIRLVSDRALRDYSEYAIVVQGPVYTKNRLTLETLFIFKRNFPNAMLILSTWADADPATLEEAKKQGIEVVQTDVLA